MKYFLKENFRLFFAKGGFYNEYGEEVYTYQNSALFLPRIDLYKYGVNIGHIQTRFSFFLARYDLIYGNEMIGSLNEKLKFISSELKIEELGWKVKGDIFALNYQIFDENEVLIASVHQELFHLTQHLSIEIYDEYNEERIVLLLTAINQYDKQRNEASSASVNVNN